MILTSGSTLSAYVQPVEFIPDGITHISQCPKKCFEAKTGSIIELHQISAPEM